MKISRQEIIENVGYIWVGGSASFYNKFGYLQPGSCFRCGTLFLRKVKFTDLTNLIKYGIPVQFVLI